ncbi:MAG: YggT family protein [Deferribacterales bacterium]
MSFLMMLIKFYLIVLLFRSVMSRQELYFNPLGKIVAKMTDPLFEKTLKINKKTADTMTPAFVLAAAVLNGVIIFAFGGFGIVESVLYAVGDMLMFLMLFYIICIILGIFAGNMQMSYYAMYFNRLASFWVRGVRTVIPIKSNWIALFAVIFVYAFFTVLIGGVNYLSQLTSVITQGHADIFVAMRIAVKNGLLSLVWLLDVYIWVVIIRALMSWVSPDPRNPVVQLLHSVTDPVMEPLRRVIPPLGPIDITPMVFIFIIYFIKIMSLRLIGIML